MNSFDLLIANARQDAALFKRHQWWDCNSYRGGVGVPGKNVIFWVHPYCMTPEYAKERYTVKVYLRVPSETFFWKLFRKRVWREIRLDENEQKTLHPDIWAIYQWIANQESIAAKEKVENMVNTTLGLQEDDYKAIKQKAGLQ